MAVLGPVPAETSDRRYRASGQAVVSLLADLASKRTFLRNVALLGTSTALAQSFNVVLAPVLTRLYSPADLGLLSLFTSFLSVAVVGTSLKYELAIVSARSDGEAAQLTWASILLSIPVSIICGVLLYATIHFSYFGFGFLPGYSVVLMVLAILLAGTLASLRYLAIRQDRFGLIARTSISQQAARSLSQTGLGLLNAGPGGLLIGELFGRTTGILLLLRDAWPSLQQFGVRSTCREMFATLSCNRKFVIYSLPSSFIDAMAANMLIPMVVDLYGTKAGGQFALVQKVLALPIALIASSVADTFHGRLAICARESPGQMLSLFKRTSLGLLLAGVGPAAIFLTAGDRVFAFAFGKSWAAAGTLAAICTPFFLAEMVVSPLSRLVVVLSGQESKLIYDILLFAGIITTFNIAIARGLTLTQTVWAFSLVNTVAFVIYYFVLARIVSKAASRFRSGAGQS